MTTSTSLVYLIALPLFGATILLLAGRRADSGDTYLQQRSLRVHLESVSTNFHRCFLVQRRSVQ